MTIPIKSRTQGSTKLPTLKFQEVPVNAASQLRHVGNTNAMLRKMTRPAINHPHHDLYERHRTRRCGPRRPTLAIQPAPPGLRAEET